MLLDKYKGRIKFYEILNEPNCFLSGEEYKKVLTRTSRLIRKFDPKAAIIAGSVVNAPRKELWKAAMSAPPGTFDMFSYHPYRFGLSNPERELSTLSFSVFGVSSQMLPLMSMSAMSMAPEPMERAPEEP